jgi:hypothetical protein
MASGVRQVGIAESSCAHHAALAQPLAEHETTRITYGRSELAHTASSGSVGRRQRLPHSGAQGFTFRWGGRFRLPTLDR